MNLWRSLPRSLVLLIASFAIISLPSASAQTTTAAAPTEATSSLPTTLATSTISSLASSLLSGTSSTLTPTSTATRPPTIDDAPQTFPSDSDDRDSTLDGDEDDRRGGLINYYFVFLAIFIVLAFLGIYFLNRRRQARRAAWRTSGENALRRDVEGWAGGMSNARRWHRREESRRVEGLNEVGEAPPPYRPKGEDMGGAEEGGPQIPMNTLARDGRERERDLAKPPEYEAVRADSTVGRHESLDAREASSSQPTEEGTPHRTSGRPS